MRNFSCAGDRSLNSFEKPNNRFAVAASMPAARTSAGRPGRPIQAENGVLRSITLTNFKAHSHFHLDFNPHVNFIVGSNGTGKSAILAGVIQALGGNPNKHSGTAGGARAAQGLIQDGKDYASVVLVLYNGSDDPWETQRASTQTQARLEEERNVTVTSELTRLAGNKTSSRYKINGVAATRKQVCTPAPLPAAALAASPLRARDRSRRSPSTSTCKSRTRAPS